MHKMLYEKAMVIHVCTHTTVPWQSEIELGSGVEWDYLLSESMVLLKMGRVQNGHLYLR